MSLYQTMKEEVKRMNSISREKIFVSYYDLDNFCFLLERNGKTIDSIILPKYQSMILISFYSDCFSFFKAMSNFEQLTNKEKFV